MYILSDLKLYYKKLYKRKAFSMRSFNTQLKVAESFNEL